MQSPALWLGVVSTGLVIVLACVAAWILVSARLRRWSVTAPIVLTLAGLALGSGADAPVHIDVEAEQVRTLAEITLALTLFTDASRISARWFEQPPSRIAARLLAIGLPLSIGLGFLVALPLFPAADWTLLALLAASLAPTDAALGASVMEDDRIPRRVRDIINVESGLNDGLATPFVLFFLALATAQTESNSLRPAGASAIRDVLAALIVGSVVGLALGWLLRASDRSGWSVPVVQPILPFATALIAYFASLAVGGNGFVAAFAAGVAFGTASRIANRREVQLFTEQAGSLLNFFVWFLFGAVSVLPAIESLTWQVGLYAVLSLTVVRMAPVALALVGTKLGGDETLMIGWLGPRGLASIVFALIIVDDLAAADGGNLVVGTITVTVALSVLLHGLSAGPVASAYDRRHPEASTPERDDMPTGTEGGAGSTR